MSKFKCDNLIANEDWLWCDKQDTDEKISRIQEQSFLFSYLYANDLFDLAYDFGILADLSEYDFKYREWEVWHCNF